MSSQPTSNPFSGRRYSGSGVWHDRSGRSGRYTCELMIDTSSGVVDQITRRVFLTEDDSELYVERSTIRFAIDGWSVAVTIVVDDGERPGGVGYLLDARLHYDIDVADDNHIENTYVFGDTSVELFGSATNKGNFTVWREVLTRI